MADPHEIDEEIRMLGRKCRQCGEDIASEADLESYNHNDKLCSRCAGNPGA